ncbi:MAG TPA: cold shock domain-containing protein [Roseiarcus sp.]|nr:cold shock domain-containing protein [Roseiarcus sp.]
MSKGKEFRAPRKRGFDDDGPMPYEPRPRGTRTFGGGPDAAFGGGAPMDMQRSAPAATGPTVDAVVKWFKADKGYGFVELANGQGDAFLHANALHSSGHESVPTGAKLKVMVGAGAKGAQVTRVVEVDITGIVDRPPPRSGAGLGGPGGGFGGGDGARPRRAAPDPSTAVSVSGKVKWFDDVKGFGFVASDDGGKDVFVHISVLGPSGISHLAEGQPVNMRVVVTPKGREAISLSI